MRLRCKFIQSQTKYVYTYTNGHKMQLESTYPREKYHFRILGVIRIIICIFDIKTIC